MKTTIFEGVGFTEEQEFTQSSQGMPPLVKANPKETQGDSSFSSSGETQFESQPAAGVDSDSMNPATKQSKMDTIEEEDFAIGGDINEEDESDDVVLFVEYKYCTVCHIEQPLRCKHCK